MSTHFRAAKTHAPQKKPKPKDKCIVTGRPPNCETCQHRKHKILGELVSRHTVANRLSLTVRTIRRYVSAGKLKVRRIGCLSFLVWEEVCAAIDAGILESTRIRRVTANLKHRAKTP